MVKTKIRIGFAGTPKIAFAHLSKLLLSDKFSVEFILTQPNKTAGRGMSKTTSLFTELSKTIPVFQFDDLRSQEAQEAIALHKVDLLVVVAYGKLIPKWLLELPVYGCLNVHFSLLPKHRGAAPMQRAIQSGEKISGVSFMKLEEGLDEGPVYKTIETVIEGKDYYEVEELLLQESLEEISNVVCEVCEGAKPENQNHSEATYAEKIEKLEGKIDWNDSCEGIKNKFLAFVGWPQTFFMLGGQEVKVISLSVHSSERGTAGKVHCFDKNSLNVFCSDGVISIKSVQFPGKKVIGSLDFFNSKRDIISKGDLLI